MIPMNLFTKQKWAHSLRECTYEHQGGRMGERRDKLEFGIYMNTTILKIDNNNNKKKTEERNVEFTWNPSTLVFLLAISRNYTIIFL